MEDTIYRLANKKKMCPVRSRSIYYCVVIFIERNYVIKSANEINSVVNCVDSFS